jgi:hypothetical protein
MGRHIISPLLVLACLCLLPTLTPAPVGNAGDAMADYVEFNIIVLKPEVDETAFVSEFRNWLANCQRLEQCKRVELLTPMNLIYSTVATTQVMEPLPRHYGWIKVWDSQNIFNTMLGNESAEYKAHVDFLHNRIYMQSVIVTLHYANTYSVDPAD